ncbi:PDZ domain-containing protein 8 isoform X2 [Nilaparvata lugens]|uniref:PDZ domain-containing protein 8 isoform X2 n=2 Tax=Nilaparvata lugens TaxID=108931 RepID=UPI00193E01EE|nr:PDZ domain-containing protein 8 isoform X2 [Nilaparvata lugens]
MDIFIAVILVVFCFSAGVVLTLVIEWYLFNLYIMKRPYVGPKDKPSYQPIKLPEALRDSIESTLGKKEEVGSLNYLFQFLFQECRNTERVRQWFWQKLTLELEELLTRTTTGKMFESIALRDLDLGNEFPAIKSVEMKEINLDPSSGLINDLELCMELDYKGGFQLSIDAAMRLSKTAHVAVKVNQLTGLGRLKFTRHPYTHWSFSFYSDPTLLLSVESLFQGRSLPQINSIIASQIRKSLKRKHTLPNHKVRYKPFFPKIDPTFIDEVSGTVPSGVLDVTILEISRITETTGPVFCSLAIDALAWVEMVHSELGSYLTMDISVPKPISGQFGVSFKQEFVPDKYQVCIIVDSVSSVVGNDACVGDILVAVDGKRVNNLSQVSKFVRQSVDKVSLRVERRLKVNAPTEEKVQEPFGLRQRRGSGDKGDKGDKTDSDSSNSTSVSDSPARRSLRGSPEHKLKIGRLSVSFDSEADSSSKLQVLTTKEQPHSQVISFNETLRFHVNSEHKYLNMSVWSKGERNTLLGHISLPLISQICVPTPGHRIKLYSLLPPDPHLVNTMNHPLSSHPGFEPCLCFGDILLAISFAASGGVGGGVSTVVTSSAAGSQQLSVPSVTTSPALAHVQSSSLAAPIIQHDFVRTHFTRTTQCGFCFKKIWLKDAFQCDGCKMTCHKKCVSKCQTSSSCARTQAERRASSHPEIITTSPDDPDPANQGSQSVAGATPTGRRLSSLLATVATKGLKRAGSATNLAPPGGHPSGVPGGSVSLPPSPQHSPSPSRKTSLADGAALFAVADDGSGRDEIGAALEALLSRPHHDDELSLDEAKASGRQLFADLPPDARKQRIDAVMTKLKVAIDAESHVHKKLAQEEQGGCDSSAKARNAFLVGKSEEKLQAMTVLMLHLCAGLQDAQDCVPPQQTDKP